MSTEINGEVTQRGSTSSMILNVIPKFILYIKYYRTKEIRYYLTSQKGWQNNFLKSGDKIKHKIEKIGEVEFYIK